MSLLPTTKLEAINEMLLAIDESPVNSITGTVPTDVSIAIDILDSVNRRIQSKGWNFNTDEDVTLTKNSDGEIELGASVVSVSSQSKNIAIRGQKIYDRDNQTFVFTSNISDATTVTILEFTDTPQSARTYITELAKRRIQQEVNGSVSADRENKEDLDEAKADFYNDEVSRTKANMGTGTSQMFNMLHRDRLVY